MNARFLTRSAMHHELMLLLAIHGRDGLALPVTPSELPAGALEQVPLARLLDEGTLMKIEDGPGARIVLTHEGLQHLRRLVVDYHLELMDLRRTSDQFIAERVRVLVDHGCRRVLLYGASDTARVLLEFLQMSPIEVAAVIDDDPGKQGSIIGNVPVIGPGDVGDYTFDSVIVTTVVFQDEILHSRKQIARTGTRFIGLFEDYRTQEAEGLVGD